MPQLDFEIFGATVVGHDLLQKLQTRFTHQSGKIGTGVAQRALVTAEVRQTHFVAKLGRCAILGEGAKFSQFVEFTLEDGFLPW